MEDFEGAMDRMCIDTLGDSIEYKEAGASGYAAVRGYVEHSEAVRDLQTGMIIEQDITVELLRADVPARPSGAARVRLPKIAGKTFRPVNVRLGESGTHWLFELEAVSA